MGRCNNYFWSLWQHRKPHKFTVEVSQISSGPVKDGPHGNSKTALYGINHKLCDAIQKMGCGPINAKTLFGFMELPSRAKSHAHLAVVEKNLGAVEEKMKLSSQEDTLQLEVAEMKNRGVLEFHKCTVEGHKHGSVSGAK